MKTNKNLGIAGLAALALGIGCSSGDEWPPVHVPYEQKDTHDVSDVRRPDGTLLSRIFNDHTKNGGTVVYLEDFDKDGLPRYAFSQEYRKDSSVKVGSNVIPTREQCLFASDASGNHTGKPIRVTRTFETFTSLNSGVPAESDRIDVGDDGTVDKRIFPYTDGLNCYTALDSI